MYRRGIVYVVVESPGASCRLPLIYVLFVSFMLKILVVLREISSKISAAIHVRFSFGNGGGADFGRAARFFAAVFPGSRRWQFAVRYDGTDLYWCWRCLFPPATADAR